MYVECEWCGKTFYRKKHDKRYTGIYCSQDCITARDQSNYKIKFLRENKVFRIVHYESKERSFLYAELVVSNIRQTAHRQ